MTIVANNSYMFNMEMDFWALKGFGTQELLCRWSEIADLATKDMTENAAFFLEDCMDVLYEKVLALPAADRNTVIDKAKADVESFNRKLRRGVA